MTPALPVGERKLRRVSALWAAVRQAAACHHRTMYRRQDRSTRLSKKFSSRAICVVGTNRGKKRTDKAPGAVQNKDLFSRAPTTKPNNAKRMPASGLRQLLASTRAIESGQKTVPVLIRTRDEVGELALAFNRMVEELRTRERIKDTFGKFLDPRIVSRLIDSGAENAERRTLTVFFSDIKDFTGISEQLTASSVVNLLNSYFGAVASVIHAHNGFIGKYIGDGVMAFWIPPFSAGDAHASDACLAALAQQEAMGALRAQLPEITGIRRNPPKLTIRMGIATGEAIVGTIGASAARSYTVIGDTVNLASRLEDINKVYGSSVILSEDTYRLSQNVIEARELDLVTVPGKTEPVRIYEAMGRAGELGQSELKLRSLFSEGLGAYRRQDWDEAQTHFESCLQISTEDGPSRLFVERIARLRNTPPSSDWDGVWHVSEKS
jgi:adenylate cyclase